MDEKAYAEWLEGFIPKRVNASALEVADFVAHAVGGQASKNFGQGHGRYAAPANSRPSRQPPA